MKRIYLTLIALVLNAVIFTASAYDIAVKNTDGVTIYYNYINGSHELEVTYMDNYNLYHKCYSGVVVIPNEIIYENKTLKVTRIGDGAFTRCSELTSISIPNSVENIGESAFYNCTKLTSVNISDVSTWCKISFSGNYSNPLEYAHHLYIDGQEINDLVIPDGMTSVNANAFNRCYSLTSVSIPNSVTAIGNSAFNECVNLTSISIPNSVTNIGSFAFDGCSSLSSASIPNSVTSIGEYNQEIKGVTNVEIIPVSA